MTIGKEQNASKKTYSAKDYICTTYCFDGIENAGYGNHSNDIHRWYDNNESGVYLASSNPVMPSYVDRNLFVISGYTTSNVEKLSYCDDGKMFKSFSGDLTFESVALLSYTSITFGGINYSDPGLASPFNFMISYYISNGARVHTTNENSFFTTEVFSPGTLVSGSLVRRNNLVKAYINGKLVTGSTKLASFLVNSTGILCDRSAKYAAIRLSDRALDDEEIAHNFEIDRKRFGI